MMAWKTSLTAVAALLLVSAAAHAGNTVQIRAVEASNKTSGVPAGLNDVASALKSMSYKGYTLKGASALPLPASGSTGVAGYTITCKGPQNSLKITVKKGRRQLLATTANLRDGKPLILGGFPSANGAMLLVLLVR